MMVSSGRPTTEIFVEKDYLGEFLQSDSTVSRAHGDGCSWVLDAAKGPARALPSFIRLDREAARAL